MKKLSKYYKLDTEEKRKKIESEIKLFNSKKTYKINVENKNKIKDSDLDILCDITYDFIRTSKCISEYRLVNHYLSEIFYFNNLLYNIWDEVFRKLRKDGKILWVHNKRVKDDLSYAKKEIDLEKQISKKASRFYVLSKPILRKTKIKEILEY